jgi:hypothetical protein
MLIKCVCLCVFYSLSKLKDQLKIFSSIPPDDQILLAGPPYKQITADLMFAPDQRVFVYNKANLNQKTKDPARILLPPFNILEPEPVPGL